MKPLSLWTHVNTTIPLLHVAMLQQGNAGGSGRTLADFVRVGISPPSDEFWVNRRVCSLQ